MVEMEYITDFLRRVEGWYTRLYIPCFLKAGGTANYIGGPNPDNYRAMGASGCTVGIGCDLGQTDEKTLLGYGLSPDVAVIFRPYYGKKKDDAIQVLHTLPLVVSESVAKELTIAVHKGYLEKYVKPAYALKSRVLFDSLPKQAQAVVMSVCYQKGVGGVRRDWPKLWEYLTTQKWRLAVNELKTGFSQYKSRRKIEGELLEELL